MSAFTPILNALPRAQRTLWEETGGTPTDFVLYGGTAPALRLGHRQSDDFDFFSTRAFEPRELLSIVPYLRGATVVREERNTLRCAADRGGEVRVSFRGPAFAPH